MVSKYDTVLSSKSILERRGSGFYCGEVRYLLYPQTRPRFTTAWPSRIR